MSGSSKKKLRKEQYEANLTQRQQAELKEARQLKHYTMGFIVAMVLIVALVIGIAVTPVITGIINRNTHAISFGEHELTTVDFSYYYMDEITAYYNKIYNEYYQTYPSFWQMFLLLNVNEPLNEQFYNEEKNVTWADHFVDEATKSAAEVFALNDDGTKHGFSLSDKEKASIDSYMSYMELYAEQSGYASLNAYLEASYGKGASKESYRAYYERNAYASAYKKHYSGELTYTNEQLKEFQDKDNKYMDYTSFTYAYYALEINSYLEFIGGGKENANGIKEYTDEQRKVALETARKDAEKLLNCGATTVIEFDEAIQKLAISLTADKDKKPKSTLYEDVFYPEVGLDEVKTWIAHSDRQKNDITCIDGKSSTTNEDGTTTEQVNKLNIFMFFERNENLTNLVDVRHILIKPAKSTDEEKKIAKEKAEALLAQWEAGDKTPESFAELANKNSSDSDGEDGGLYEKVYPGQMVENFDNWCFDPARKVGDTGIVETDYGYHVMYFEKYQDETFRDYMVKLDMVEKDTNTWLESLTKDFPVNTVNTSGLKLDFTFTY